MSRIVLGLLVLTLGSTGIGAEVDTNVRVVTAVGHDTNPLRVSGDGADGSFGDLRLDFDLTVPIRPTVRYFLETGGFARSYTSDTDDAGYRFANVRTGVTLWPIRAGGSRLFVSFGGGFDMRRYTFVDRATGLVYEVDADPPTVPASTVAIPDRFDSNVTSQFVDLRWMVNRKLRFYLETVARDARFVADYSATTGLDPLDYRSVTFKPGVLYQINDFVAIGFTEHLTEVDYTNRPGLDAGGAEVPGTERSYRYAEHRLTVKVTPTNRWDVRVGVRDGDRSESLGGYYDLAATTTFLSMTRTFGPKDKLWVYASNQDVDYERATVINGAQGELRASEAVTLTSRYDRKLSDNLGFFVEGGAQRVDNQDPVFAHDRDWFLTGITYER